MIREMKIQSNLRELKPLACWGEIAYFIIYSQCSPWSPIASAVVAYVIQMRLALVDLRFVRRVLFLSHGHSFAGQV
jgi:hypothetical protein